MRNRVFAVVIVLLLTSSVVYAVENSYEFVCDISNIEWETTPQGYIPKLNGCENYKETDRPIIPQLIGKVILPPNTKVSSAQVFAQYTELPLPGVIATAGSELCSDGNSLIINRLESSTDIWPTISGEYIGESTMHGVTVASFRLFPLRYSILNHSAEITDTFTVVFTLNDTFDVCSPVRYVGADFHSVADFVDGAVNEGAYINSANRNESPSNQNLQFTDMPSLNSSSVEYLVITSEEMNTVFEEYALYKSARGIPTTVRTVDWINSHYPVASDQQERIRNFIREAYQDWGTRFVLLGGDVSVIPARMIHNTFYPPGQGTVMPVDLYYSCLDGNWNADGDQNVGEAYVSSLDPGDFADLTAELFIGRAPVTNVEQATVFFNKVRSYEQESVGPQNGNGLFLSEVLFPSDYIPGGDLYEDGAEFSEEIIDQTMYDAAIEPYRLYEAYDLWDGAYPETHAETINQLNSSNYGLVVHIGHGFFYNMSVGDGTLNNANVDNLENDNYYVLSSLNCASAAIDYNSILERFITNGNGGAVATIGSSRAAFPGTSSRYQVGFFSALYQTSTEKIGQAIAQSRLPYDHLVNVNTIERWTHMAYTLIGDPSLMYYGQTPDTLQVVTNSSINIGAQDIEVTVLADQLAVEGAIVTLYRDGDDYATMETDGSGIASLGYTATSPGEITCTVVKKNFLPSVIGINCLDSGDAYLSVNDYTIIDDGSFGTVGNGDGQPGSGERAILQLDLINSGTEWATASEAQLFAVSEQCSIITSSVSVPELGIGEIAEDVSFVVQFSEELSNGSALEIQLLVSSDTSQSNDSFILNVVSAEITPSIMSWSDYPSGNGNGVIEVGEEIELFFNLYNSGWADAIELTGDIVTLGPEMEVLESNDQWPVVESMSEQVQQNRFLVTLNDVRGSKRGKLVISDLLGHSWEHYFDLVKPTRPTMTGASSPAGGTVLLSWEPVSDQDLLGYHLFRSDLPNGPFDRITETPLDNNGFYRDYSLDPLTKYYYKVAATDSSRLISQLSQTVSVSTSPSEISGFPIAMDLESSSHCAVGDITGDGNNEVIFASDYLYVWGSDGIEIRDGDSNAQTNGPFTSLCGDWGPSGVTLIDVTDDPGLEIIACCRLSKKVFVIESDGSVAEGWPQQMLYWNWATSCAGDIDNDNDIEIVVNDVRGHTYVWNHDGSEYIDGDNDPSTSGIFHVREQEWFNHSSPALADLDGNLTLEIIFSSRLGGATNYLYALGLDGQNISGWPYELAPDGYADCAPAVGDLNFDGDYEVVVVTEDDQLHVIKSNGLPMAPFPIAMAANSSSSGAICPSPALADFDGDNLLEIVAVEINDYNNGKIHLFDIDGNDLPGWPKEIAGNSESSPVVADISGDGLLDIVFGIGGGSDTAPNLLYAFKHNGAAVPGFPLSLSGPVRSTPTLCDFDQDSDIDIVYGGWDMAMHVWDMNATFSVQTAPWPTYHGNINRTGFYNGATISGVSSPVYNAIKLHQNVPNPFNPVTEISFELPVGFNDQVTVNIYDLMGRNVKSLLEEHLDGGTYSVMWFGDDNSGNQASSGVYFYRLESGIEFATGRMTLVR